MKINNMTTYREIKPNYIPYYVATVVTAIAIGYFLLVGGKLLRALFILGYQYWWVCILIVLVIFFLKKKMRKK